MRGMIRRVAAVTALLLTIMSAVLPVAHAAAPPAATGPFNVIVSPVAQTLVVKPDGSVSTTIQVQNQGNTTEHLKALIYTFGANGEDGTPQLIKPTATDDFINWATLSTTQFDAEPNVWSNVKLTIHPPKTAAFGYYYAVIFSRVNQQTVTKQSNLLGAAASLVLLDVQAPGAQRKLDISEFSTARKSMEFLPASFTVRMHNTGNTHVAPRGNIFIKKGGKTVGLLEVNLAKGQILPNSYRVFTADWNDGTPHYLKKMVNGNVVMDKAGKPVSALSWSNFNLSKLRFGHYTAQLVMVYNNGDGDVSDTAELSFWIIPWRIIGIGLLALLFVGAGLWAVVVRPILGRVRRSRKSNVRR